MKKKDNSITYRLFSGERKRKKAFGAVAALLLMAALPAAKQPSLLLRAYAADSSAYPANRLYEITSTYNPGIALHTEPDIDSDVLVRVPNGSQFYVSSVSGTYGYTTWQGYTGWINLKYAKTDGSPASSGESAWSTGTYEITSTYDEGIALHPQPDKHSDVLGRIPYQGQFYVSSISGHYGYTTYNGISGWINLTYAKMVETPAASGASAYEAGWYYEITSTYDEGIALHPEPDKKSSVLGRIPYMGIFYVYSVSGNYGYTIYNGISGWINLDYARMVLTELNPQAQTENTVPAQPSPGSSVLLTQDEAYDSVYNHLDADTIYRYHGYIIVDTPTEDEYVIKVRSYTTAIGYYYVNKYTGDVYVSWQNPVTNVFGERKYQYTITP